jgi:hypothetical protein
MNKNITFLAGGIALGALAMHAYMKNSRRSSSMSSSQAEMSEAAGSVARRISKQKAGGGSRHYCTCDDAFGNPKQQLCLYKISGGNCQKCCEHYGKEWRIAGAAS